MWLAVIGLIMVAWGNLGPRFGIGPFAVQVSNLPGSFKNQPWHVQRDKPGRLETCPTDLSPRR